MTTQNKNEASYWSCGAFTGLMSTCSFWDEEVNDADYDYKVNGRSSALQNDSTSTQRNTSVDVRTQEECRNSASRLSASASPGAAKETTKNVVKEANKGHEHSPGGMSFITRLFQ